MAAEDIGKINPQMMTNLAEVLMKKVEALSNDRLGEFFKVMVESTGQAVREQDRAIQELAPNIFWLKGVEVAYDYDNPQRKIYVINLLNQLVEQQQRIRLLERRVDDLTEKNIELSWRVGPTNGEP